jgi:hypothetical protein
LGEVEVNADRINLFPERTRKLTVSAAYEEGFSGDIAILVEDLPPGVEAVTGIEAEIKAPPREETYKEDCYLPRTQKSTLLLRAREDAPATTLPHTLRLVVRPVVDGRQGPRILVREIPLAVVRKRS